jgi:hypothetical protein
MIVEIQPKMTQQSSQTRVPTMGKHAHPSNGYKPSNKTPKVLEKN